MILRWIILPLSAIAPCLLGACGTKSFAVKEAPAEPLRAFGQVEVRPFTASFADNATPETKAEAQSMALLIGDELRDRLAKKKLFDREGRKLVVNGRLGAYDPGSQAVRYFIGLGAGSGEILVELNLIDDAGVSVASGTAHGTVSGGLFGGTVESAGRRVARVIAQFIEENYESVVAKPEGGSGDFQRGTSGQPK
jgi:hypothetical protein